MLLLTILLMKKDLLPSSFTVAHRLKEASCKIFLESLRIPLVGA